MRLNRRVAVITGGTSGIGRAMALLFAQEGARVAVTGRNEERGRKVVSEIEQAGGSAIFVKSDVRFAEECRRAVEETVNAFESIDILCNNAGVYYRNSVVDCTEEEWDLQVDIMLKGTFLMSKYTLPLMIEKGSGVIINISSACGLVGEDKGAAYCAAKGGVITLTKTMAKDHGHQGVRVNCICPGDTETPMLFEDAKLRGVTWESYLKDSSSRPLGRIGQPEDVAKTALFLASDDSSFMSGAVIKLDGGGKKTY
ncbi:MAG: SDR family oxidoreductase [Deltaproteobacteria bacterium]|nr:SDR family oxidoreductase [Deltaproteobacteria bacterium]